MQYNWLAFGYLLLLHFLVRLYEEPSLESRFGDPYRRYKATVYRWLPRLRASVPAQ